MTIAVSTVTAPRPKPFLRFLIGIRINSVSHSQLGRPLVYKRRSWLSRRVAALANFYFSMAHIPIRFCSNPREWQHREVDSFRILNTGHSAFAPDSSTVAAQKLPGENLFSHLKHGTLTRKMVIAAGREYRRCHELHLHGDNWTHGDATMSNVLYDASTGRCRLIDFELHHVCDLPLNQRRADDLHVFLMDLASYAPERRWLPLALAFLSSYDSPQVICQLKKMFAPPRGLARIWWSVRTNFADPGKVCRRLSALHRALSRTTLPT